VKRDPTFGTKLWEEKHEGGFKKHLYLKNGRTCDQKTRRAPIVFQPRKLPGAEPRRKEIDGTTCTKGQKTREGKAKKVSGLMTVGRGEEVGKGNLGTGA